MIWILLISSLGIMIIGGILQAWFFSLYNEKFHPFRDILVNDEGTIYLLHESSYIINNSFEKNSALYNEFFYFQKLR